MAGNWSNPDSHGSVSVIWMGKLGMKEIDSDVNRRIGILDRDSGWQSTKP